MITRRALVSMIPAGFLAAHMTTAARGADLSPLDASSIAEEAFIYGFPLVLNYASLYASAIDTASPQYKAPFNHIYNRPRLFAPDDTRVASPNNDGLYSVAAIDLRAQPFVFCHPPIEAARYSSVRLIDMYSRNFGSIGSRTTGNGPGCFVIAGPDWDGEAPHPIREVFRCETSFALALVRTQVFDAGDLADVQKIQANYRADPLPKFWTGESAEAAPEIAWPSINEHSMRANPFAYLNFLLQFCPPIGFAADEAAMRARFALIGIEAGKPFPAIALTGDQKAAVEDGAQRGLAKIEQAAGALGKTVNGWRIVARTSTDRKPIGGDWTRRAAVAMAALHGPDAAEALEPVLVTDSEGQTPDGKHRYTLTFPAGGLPPVNAFWSVTMYDARRGLVANPIDRYLINAAMLPGLQKGADGAVTVYIQKDHPGAEKEPNWLPAPDGPIGLTMRLYWPEPAALDGTWSPPALRRVV
jgi:hypothetical protein